MQFLADWALRSSILILSGGLLLLLLRVKDSSIKLAAWTAILCGSFALPFLTAVLPKVPLPMLRQPARPMDSPAAIVDEVAPARAFTLPNAGAAPRAALVTPFDWSRIVILICGLTTAALLLRLCAGVATGLRLFHRARAIGRAIGGIDVLESDLVASPVTLGIVRPAILLPADWREWDAAKLDAVLAHERSHIRRHDPAVQLLSSIHRALLWYSPLSWLLHRQIVRVAEEASDDAAVAAIQDRAAYAEVLLYFMQRGVRGANWVGVPMARYGSPDQRIHRILDATVLSRGVTRWSVAAILLLGAPLAYVVAASRPQSAAPQTTEVKPLRFEVVSVKPTEPPAPAAGRKGSSGPATNSPGRIHYPHRRIKDIVMAAYNLKEFQVSGPDWLNTSDYHARVDIDATMPLDTSKDQVAAMLRSLLADRFKLAFHWETKEVPRYTLTAAKGGLKIKESPDTPDAAEPKRLPDKFDQDGLPDMSGVSGRMNINGRSRISGHRMTMPEFVEQLSEELRTPVSDGTGLTAKYDFVVTFATPDWHHAAVDIPEMGVLASAYDGMAPLPDLSAAIQSQLGLKLDVKKGPLQVMVIDHILQVPTEN